MNGSIRRRSKSSWEITIDLGKDADGKRHRKFVNVKGKKSDAERKLRELLARHDRGLSMASPKITVSQWLGRWMKEVVQPNRKLRTYEKYAGIIDKHLIPVVGHVQLDQLKPADVRQVQTALMEKGLSPTTVECCHWVLSSAMTYALRMEVVYRNPVQAVEPPKIVKKEIDPPPVSVVNRILKLARVKNNELFPALWLTTYTGVRRGECLGLTWSNVELDLAQISVTQALVRSNTQGLLLETPKSNASRRVIDLDEETVSVLRDHRRQQLEHRLMLGSAYEDLDLVFPNEFGRYINPMKMTRALARLASAVDFPGLRPHDLRHFHASILLQSGMNIVLVSKRLGHSSVSMTLDIYGHLLPGWQKEAAVAFAQAMAQG